MTGGTVAESTNKGLVTVEGRVSAAGAKVAPASGAGKWSVSGPTANVFTITFAEPYAEFLGVTWSPEGGSGGTNAYVPTGVTWTASTKALTVEWYDAGVAAAAANIAFSFCARFSDNRAP